MRLVFFCLLLMSSPAFGLLARISFVKQNYTGSEPIQLVLSVYNTNNKSVNIALSDTLNQTISFELRTTKNEIAPLKPSVDAQTRTIYANPSLYRYITLEPNEVFSRIFDLRDFFDITAFSSYYVKASFFPDPDNRAEFFESDYTVFTHIPPVSVQQEMVRVQTEREKILQEAKLLLPSESIADLFEAQAVKDWERFLVHIDAERLINSFDNYARQYNAAREGSFKLDILENFKRFLTAHWNSSLISYDVKETLIQENKAYVTVDAVEGIRFTSRRLRYNFVMYKNGAGQWLIEDYTVLALN